MTSASAASFFVRGGNGLSSIRLFEALEAGRVPVIISDALLLPRCVDWKSCAVIVSEADIARIPQLLAAQEAGWENLARQARREWERCFGQATLLPTLTAELRSIQAARRRPERSQRYYFPFRVLPDYMLARAKALVRRVQSARRPPEAVSDPRSLILTVACGYQPGQVAPFVDSWRRHLPQADLAVIAGDLPEDTDRYLDAAGATIIPAEFNLGRLVGWRKAWYRLQLAGWLAALRRSRRLLGLGAEADALQARIAEASFHLFSQRFFHYRRYLVHFGWKYSHVLLVDIRDTIFQGSPFPCEGLHVFAENETIATNHFARRWFQLSYGTATFRRLGPQPLLCAGVTLGDLAAMRRYLDLNCAESLRVSTVNDVDQAVHNYLVHERLMPATIHAYGEGPAINLNAVPLSLLNVRAGRLLDATDRPYAVVHQYDRVPGLKLIP